MVGPELTPERVRADVVATLADWLPGYVQHEDETGERQHRVRLIGVYEDAVRLTYEKTDGTGEERSFVVGIAVGELA